jgi:hypothetical protein
METPFSSRSSLSSIGSPEANVVIAVATVLAFFRLRWARSWPTLVFSDVGVASSSRFPSGAFAGFLLIVPIKALS